MGWEQRGTQWYYYTAERISGRVVKHYVGSGRVAELASELDRLTQAERDSKVESERLARAELIALEESLRPLNELADGLVKAALVAAGFHRHQGKWRKRRG
jgi:hypothetical protein